MRWARRNLFGTWYDSALTVAIGTVTALFAWRTLRFVFVTARWEIVRVNITNLLVGLYPRDELWRAWAAAYFVALAVGLTAGAVRVVVGAARPSRAAARWWPVVLLALVLVVMAPSPTSIVLTLGLGAAALAGWALRRMTPPRARWSAALPFACAVGAIGSLAWFGGAGWDRWGGLLLTVFLAAGGIVLSFPLGVMLALGRRSSLPAMRVLSTGYIELIRGVPLITLLFMGAFAIGFLFPAGTSRPSLVTRGLMALVLFTSAYVAEIVRGGLQAVPAGQTEAALALGLPPIRTTFLVVLPQALRAVIPAMVGQFISLFKDTSLFAVIGLTELLRVSETITSQPQFLAQGLHAETLLFASFVYWVGSYSMSRESQRMERRLGVGTR